MTVHDPLLGRVLKDQYRLDAVLGRGAMGIVYRGTQLDLGKPIAVKVLLQSSYADPDARARFRREATLASKLNHPGIGQVFDFGLEGETPFLVMEYVEGKELSEVLAEEGALAPSRALVIMRQLASVLQEAQRNQLVHRAPPKGQKLSRNRDLIESEKSPGTPGKISGLRLVLDGSEQSRAFIGTHCA